MKKNKKNVVGAFLGTIVEYYDYSLYAFSAGIIASKFFPNTDKILGLLYVFAIYSLSYLAKPLGSLFFSNLGDKYGRKISLRITMIGIAFPTLIIGLLPEYKYIGVWSTYILVACRFLQGFFAAGEYDGAAIYVMEHFGKNRQFTASAFTRTTGVIGLLLAIAISNFFNSSIFPDWGWRVPFLLSVPFAGITIYFRQFLEETPDFIESKKEEIKFLNVLTFIKKRFLTLLCVIFLAGGFGATYQVSVILMKEYLPITVPEIHKIITTFSVIIVFLFGAMMPISGIMADRLGCLKIVRISLISTLFSCVLLAISINYCLLNLVLISWLILAISVAPFNALAHGIMLKAFQTNERYRGLGLGHTIGSMLMSGSANYICLYFVREFKWQLFPIIYIMLFSFVTFFMARIFLSDFKK